MADNWSSLPESHNLSKFAADLPAILQETGHDEMYGVKLQVAEEG